MTTPALPQGAGYGVLVGVGLAFAVGMIGTTAALRRYQKEKVSSEEFATAGRSVNTGLIAAAVVSSWTWAATLLQSTTQAYTNGVSGPFWYAAGAMVQIVLFTTVSIELKKKAPAAHTYLEVVRARFGPTAHVIFMLFGAATNILVTAMLLAGGSATVEFLTGMNPIAAIFLLPLGVMVYTLFGGLKATFLTDYVHTVILLVIIFIFVFNAYAENSYLGSPGRVWELLTQLAKQAPIEGNAEGSYLTMKSKHGGIFLVINLAGNFGTVFLDNGYWNKAIAASPAAALPGYLLGGIAWFAIPWLTATTMGLAGLCLESTPYWPSYPNKMTPAEVSAGLTLPNTAVALLGKGGGAAALIIVFMAVTSASSAEMVSASSIVTYDIYRAYINPQASGRKLIMCTHISVVVFTLAMCGFSVGLYYGGVSMGYLYVLMGVIISSAVVPACLTIFWSGLNKVSACVAPPLGFGLGIMAWLVTASKLADGGKLTVETTGSDYPMLAGNVVSLCSPILIVPICQLIFGNAHYDFNDLKQLKSVHDEIDLDSDVESKHLPEEKIVDTAEARYDEKWSEDEAILQKYSRWAKLTCVFITLCFIIIWPMPMYGSGYIFSKKFFTGWVIVGIIWLFFSIVVVGILPLWQGRYALAHTTRGIYWDVTGQSWKLRQWQDSHVKELHQSVVPGEEPVIMDGTEVSPLSTGNEQATKKE